MAIYKVTLVFSSQGYGWTEGYFIQSSATQPSVVFAQNAQQLVALRLAMLGQGAFLNYVRVSTVLTPFFVSTNEIQNAEGLYNVSAAFPNTALLIRFSGLQAGPQKNLFLRGVPYTIIGPDGQFKSNATWLRAYNAWKGYISGPNNSLWGWYGVQNNVKSNLTTYVQDPDSFLVSVTVRDPIFTAPIGTKQNVRFTGVNGKSELNGTWPVTVVSTTTVKTVKPFGVVPYVHGGYATVFAHTFTFNASTQEQRIMTRKAGRQLFLEHGRQAARIRV
jgi:hypothetical protein